MPMHSQSSNVVIILCGYVPSLLDCVPIVVP